MLLFMQLNHIMMYHPKLGWYLVLLDYNMCIYIYVYYIYIFIYTYIYIYIYIYIYTYIYNIPLSPYESPIQCLSFNAWNAPTSASFDPDLAEGGLPVTGSMQAHSLGAPVKSGEIIGISMDLRGIWWVLIGKP